MRVLVWTVVAVAVLAAGCTEPVVPVPDAAPAGPASLQRVHCAADIRAGVVSCGRAAMGASGALILGGQGTYVQLTAANPSYSPATSTFQFDVVVQNLTAQRLGTTDGITPSGVHAFITSGPTVTSGAGVVGVQNPDGVGTFTAPNQPFFAYAEVLDIFGGGSSPKTWKFDVPPTVSLFTFTVLVSAATPQETGVLRWSVERGVNDEISMIWGVDRRNVFSCGSTGGNRYDGQSWRTFARVGFSITTAIFGLSTKDVWCGGGGVADTGNIAHYSGLGGTEYRIPLAGQVNGIWASSRTDVWASTSRGSVVHFDGLSWSESKPATSEFLWGIRGTSPTNIWVVGRAAVSGTPPRVYRFDGTTWHPVTVPTTQQLRGVWPMDAQTVWVVGAGGVILRTTDGGASWTAMSSPTANQLYSIWAVSPTEIYAAGDGGTVIRYNGTSWTDMSPPASHNLKSVWASGPGDVWVAGWSQDRADAPWHFDGVSWTQAGNYTRDANGNSTVNYRTITGVSASDVWVAGGGQILRNQGTGWQVRHHDQGKLFLASWASGPSDVWFAAADGMVTRWNGSTFTTSATAAGSKAIRGISGTSSTNVFAVGDTSLIQRWNGSGWATMSSPVATGFNAVLAVSATDVWAVGLTASAGLICQLCTTDAALVRFNGTSWSKVPVLNDTKQSLYALWAASPTDLWAVGDSSTIVRCVNGTCAGTSLGLQVRLTSIWGSGPNDIWIGGVGGLLVHFDGSAWRLAASGAGVQLSGIWGTGPTDFWVAGSLGYIARASR